MNSTIQKFISSVKFFSGSHQRQWDEFAQHHSLIAILCYHTVSPQPQQREDLFDFEHGIAEKDFEAQVKFMLKHFQPVKASEIFQKENTPGKYFAVTFDDGLEDNYTVAAPILKKLGVSAAFHVVSEYVGTDKVFWWERLASILRATQKPSLTLQGLTPAFSPFEDLPREFKLNTLKQRESAHTLLCKRLSQGLQREVDDQIRSISEILEVDIPEEGRSFPLMNWEQVKDLARQDFEIGGHSATHINLGKATAKELQREVVDSVRDIESRINDKVPTFAYPYGGPGNFSEEAAQAVQSAGCHTAFTFERQCAIGNPSKFLLPRISFKKGWDSACAYHLQNAFLAGKARSAIDNRKN